MTFLSPGSVKDLIHRALFLALLFSGLPISVQAEDTSCISIRNAIAASKSRQEQLRTLINKNQQYIAANPRASPSVHIKIKSNLLMANLQIETLSNEMLSLGSQLKEKGCGNGS